MAREIFPRGGIGGAEGKGRFTEGATIKGGKQSRRVRRADEYFEIRSERGGAMDKWRGKIAGWVVSNCC